MSSSRKSDTVSTQAISRDLLRRLQTGRNRKAQVSAEFREELIDALSMLVDLTEQQSTSVADLVPATNSPITAAGQTVEGLACETGHSGAFISLSPAELESLVNRAVTHSLANWQPPLPRQGSKDGQSDHAQVAELESLVGSLEHELSAAQHQLQSVNDRLSETLVELQNCQSQLESAQQRSMELEFQAFSDDHDSTVDRQLQQQLDELQNELADLREQNADLAAQLAQRTANAATANCSAGRNGHEQLSWEERKVLILKQLQGDDSLDVPELTAEERMNIQEIVTATDRELSKRDEQIDELREIISMQSNAHDGLAIGAAGVASLIDSDELVQQERQKLREIQQEWEAKLRQAEIDLSMERAKIARERSALEKQKEQLVNSSDPTTVSAKKERRWLSALGLGEESTGKATG